MVITDALEQLTKTVTTPHFILRIIFTAQIGTHKSSSSPPMALGVVFTVFIPAHNAVGVLQMRDPEW